MTEITSVPRLLAMAPAPGQNMFVSLVPLVVMLAIFYFIVLMPMRKRQKKVEEFRASLKVGDKVIFGGGIFGQVTRLGDTSVQIQIADKVKVEVSRAAVAGYQGQEPLVQTDGSGGL